MEETERKECESFDIKSATSDVDLKKKGQIACGLITRLESYKMTLEGIKDQEDYFSDQQANYGFDNVVDAIDTEYSDIDKMTSISSRELVNEAEAIKNSEEDAKKLQEECKDGNTDEKCTKALSGLSESEADGINLETKIANEVYKQRLEKLGASGSEEEFKKFLEDNNLLEKYGKQLDTLTPAKLATIISNDYTSKKNALKNEMMDKYLSTKESSTDPKEEAKKQASTLKEKADELKEEKSYIETMFEYNNIVTSYLDLTLEKQENGRTVKESVGSFDQNRKNELEAIKKYAKDDQAAMEDYENYQEMFNDKDSAQSDSGKSADDIDFLSFIDGVLGVE
jgi:hypothetical protein